jgi:hypothetical protein
VILGFAHHAHLAADDDREEARLISLTHQHLADPEAKPVET